MHSRYIPVPKSLLTTMALNSYSDEGHAAKAAFHKDGTAFLKKLAAALGMDAGTFEVRSNKGGIAVSGEVTLHSDDLYIQLSDSVMGPPGVRAMIRTCSSRKDYTGHQNTYTAMRAFVGTDEQLAVVERLRGMIADERRRKASLTTSA